MIKTYHTGRIRLDTTVAGERVQRYYRKGERVQAEEDHRLLREEAKAYQKYARVHGPRKQNQFAVGLTAYIHREVKRRDGVEAFWYVPVFRVSRGGRQSHIEFRISTRGFTGAYQQAVEAYVRHWGLQNYREELLRRQPSKEWFMRVMAKAAKRKWRHLSLDDIQKQLENRP